MRDIILDFRYALRALRAAPGSTISAVATLALGIGMTTAIFSVVHGIVLRPLPFARENRLITLCEQYPGATSSWCSISPPNIEDIAARARTIEAIGIGRGWPYHLDTPNGAEGLRGGLASPGLFRALGVHAEQGRLIEPNDLIGRQSTVGVITHEMWRARFGGRPDIVGHVVSIDREPVTIVGVLEPGFQLPRFDGVEFWRPLHINPKDEQHREWRGFVSFALVKPGMSIDAARREIAGIASQLRAEHFATTAGWDIRTITTRDLVVGDARNMLFVFLGAVIVVLLIGCANVANLLLARATARRREIAVRAALGARPARIVRALLVESLVLAVIGGAAGVGLAVGATGAFKSLAPPDIPRVADVLVDRGVLLFALALTLGTTLVFGLVPALRAVRTELSPALREGGRGGAARRGRLGPLLVAGELALAVTLVASGGLLTRSFLALTAWRPGFEQEHLLTFSVFAPTSSNQERMAVASLWQRMESELASLPGVVGVGTASAGPLFGARETWEMEFTNSSGTSRASVRWFDAGPTFFSTLRVPLLRGRMLDERDNAGAPIVGVVNETLARRFWPGEDPVGKTLVFPHGNERAEFQVVGVVKDVPPLRPDAPIEPQLYWSNRQQPRPFTYVLVRTTVPPASLVPAIRDRVKSIDRDLDAAGARTLPERLGQELTTPRFTMLVVAAFGIAALLLAAIGTYGLLSYVVTQRRREIGIRLALGAQRRQVLGSILRSGLALAAMGVVAGTMVTLAGGRLVRSLVVGVSVYDPATLVVAAFVLIGIATLACLVPAWRASRVDPVMTLGSE